MMTPDLRPASIRAYWPVLQPLFARALRGDDDTPESIYTRVAAGDASLFVGDGAAFVLTAGVGRAVPTVRVWLMVSWGPHGATDRHLPALVDLARANGARRLVFTSCRRGWARKVKCGNGDAWTTYILRI